MTVISSLFTLISISFSLFGTVKLYTGGNVNWLIQLAILSVALFAAWYSSMTSPVSFIRQGMDHLRRYKVMLLGWGLLMVGIAMAGIMHHNTGLYTLAKYTLFIIVLCSLLCIPQLTPRLLEKAIITALLLALLPLIIFALLRQNNVLVVFGDGRMGWLAAWPGVIWKIGALIWPYAAWQNLKQVRLRTLGLALCALLLMAVDGSRTSMLWIALVWLALAGLACFSRTSSHPVKSHLGLAMMLVLSFAVVQPALIGWVRGEFTASLNHFGFSKTVLESCIHVTDEKSATLNRITQGDNQTRARMLKVGWQHAVENFPWGGGFDSTRTEDFGVQSVIHMTYLQLLADEGILGLAGYLLFLTLPLYRACRYLLADREKISERIDLLITPVSAIILLMFISCFHPLSNELNEWAVILAALALVIRYVPVSK